MQPSPRATKGTYRPLAFEAANVPVTRARQTAVVILRAYFGGPTTITRWRKAGRMTTPWQDTNGIRQESQPITFDELTDYLLEHRSFTASAFNLPPLLSRWLDASVEMSPQFHAPGVERPDVALTFEVTPAISSKFPLVPALDREGRAFSSFQLVLLKALMRLRTLLVDQSEQLFSGEEWLDALFNYLNTAVACVDNTLHQIYYRAKYEGASSGWRFDETKLGKTHDRRLRDKIAWVGQITGRAVDNCRDEVNAFVELKDVRNHLNHFDPPVLAFSIEDVARWLNSAGAIADLLLEIRNRVGEPPCEALVSLLLAPTVAWIPHDPGKRRVPQRRGTGYSSTCWR